MSGGKDQSNKIPDISIRQSWHTFSVDPCEVGQDSNRISHSEFQVISFSRFPLEQNRINNLHFNSSATQAMVRMSAQSKNPKKYSPHMCVQTTIYCIFAVCLSIRVWFVCFPITFICEPDRLHAFVQFHSSVCLYKANIDQLLLHPKPPLCPLYCTKLSLQLTLHVYTNAHINTQNALGVMQHADWTRVKVIHLCALSEQGLV